MFPYGTDCFSSYFNSSYHMPLRDILEQLARALNIPKFQGVGGGSRLTRLYLKLPSYRVS